MIRTLTTTVFWTACLLLHGSTFAQTTVTQGEYFFGPDKSENTACHLAELQAKQNALLKVNGQSLSLDESYVCSEKVFQQDGNSICALNKFLWSQIFGTIKSGKVLDQRVESLSGAKRCIVQLEVLMASPTQPPAPNFDVTASLSHSEVRVGEKIRIDVNPLSPGFLAVFNWIPSVSEGGHLHKIFPNAFQSEPFLSEPISLPSKDYELMVISLDQDQQRDTPVITKSAHIEHFVFLLSRELYAWPATISYEQFSEKLSEIKPSDVRVRKKSLIVLHKN